MRCSALAEEPLLLFREEVKMPKIEEILQQERGRNQQKNDRVWLYKEGTFWRAYEKSAYQLHQQFGLKPLKRHIKAVKQDIVYVGFPASSWQKFFTQEQPTTEKQCAILVCSTINELDFEQWKTQLPYAEKTTKAPVLIEATNPQQEVIDKLINFPLERSTPMEAMLLVAELKRILQEGK